MYTNSFLPMLECIMQCFCWEGGGEVYIGGTQKTNKWTIDLFYNATLLCYSTLTDTKSVSKYVVCFRTFKRHTSLKKSNLIIVTKFAHVLFVEKIVYVLYQTFITILNYTLANVYVGLKLY